MWGSGFQFNRSRGADRFYNPVTARSSYLNQQMIHQLQRAQSDDTMGRSAEQTVLAGCRKPESRAGETPEFPALQPATLPLCNMERFLRAITPSVPSQYLSKTIMRGWRNCDVGYQPYFVLADLWESFKEWSAYGAGVPLLLNDSDCVVQYYVPYLSAIQIFVEPSKSRPKSRRGSEDSEGEYFSRDSSSDGSDFERERISTYPRGQKYPHFPTTDIAPKMEKLSLRDQHVAMQEGFSSDDGESVNSEGRLLFQYLEHDAPYCREPLYDKISDLALRFPELKNLQSCDVTSSSWVSVAWYPIYRIPTGPTLRDLDACFLTYHSLYTPMGDVPGAQASVLIYPNRIGGVPKISLRIFGLSTYKFKGSMWTPKGRDDRQLVTSLSQAADDWLRDHGVNHPDHTFFSSRL